MHKWRIFNSQKIFLKRYSQKDISKKRFGAPKDIAKDLDPKRDSKRYSKRFHIMQQPNATKVVLVFQSQNHHLHFQVSCKKKKNLLSREVLDCLWFKLHCINEPWIGSGFYLIYDKTVLNVTIIFVLVVWFEMWCVTCGRYSEKSLMLLRWINIYGDIQDSILFSRPLQLYGSLIVVLVRWLFFYECTYVLLTLFRP